VAWRVLLVAFYSFAISKTKLNYQELLSCEENFHPKGSLSLCEFQTMFNALETLVETICSQLLVCVGSSQMTKVLNNRCLTRFKISQTRLNFSQLALDAILTGLKPLQVFQNQVFGSISHDALTSIDN
jgi:hypothetical protein